MKLRWSMVSALACIVGACAAPTPAPTDRPGVNVPETEAAGATAPGATGAVPPALPGPAQVEPAAEVPAPATTLIEIPNARLHDGVLVGGQPTRTQFETARKVGFKTIVNLRGPREPGVVEEAALMRELGLDYIHIPITGPSDLTRDNAAALATALAKPGPILVHCASGNRVGALFGLKAYWIEGRSAEQAMATALSAGVTSLRSTVHDLLTKK